MISLISSIASMSLRVSDDQFTVTILLTFFSWYVLNGEKLPEKSPRMDFIFLVNDTTSLLAVGSLPNIVMT